VDLLIALHKVVQVHFEVDGVTHVLESIIGVKQGDIYLGACPLQLYHLRGGSKCGIRRGGVGLFRTKGHAVLVGRNWKESGGAGSPLTKRENFLDANPVCCVCG
jgi:hypothetical protein